MLYKVLLRDDAYSQQILVRRIPADTPQEAGAKALRLYSDWQPHIVRIDYDRPKEKCRFCGHEADNVSPCPSCGSPNLIF